MLQQMQLENSEAEEQTGPPPKRQRVDDAQPYLTPVKTSFSRRLINDNRKKIEFLLPRIEYQEKNDFNIPNYKTIRHDMIEWVQSIVTLVDQHKRPNLSTSLLLAPSGYKQINSRVSGEILGCTFEYIGKSKRRL